MNDLAPLDRSAIVTGGCGAIVYLASPEASFVHGTRMVVDGGFSAR